MKKLLWIVFIFFCWIISTKAQSTFLDDGSFEIATIYNNEERVPDVGANSPSNGDILKYPQFFFNPPSAQYLQYWFRPTGASSDWFYEPIRNPSRVHVDYRIPDNNFCQSVNSQDNPNMTPRGYAGFMINRRTPNNSDKPGSDNYREYLSTKLKNPLLNQHTYRIKYWVLLPTKWKDNSSSRRNVDNFDIGRMISRRTVQICLSQNVVDISQDQNSKEWYGPINKQLPSGRVQIQTNDMIVEPYLEGRSYWEQYYAANNQWVEEEIIVCVSGGDKHYLTIGNFDSELSMYDIVESSPSSTAEYNFYVCIDNISIEDLGATSSECSLYQVFQVEQAANDPQYPEFCCYDFFINIDECAILPHTLEYRPIIPNTIPPSWQTVGGINQFHTGINGPFTFCIPAIPVSEYENQIRQQIVEIKLKILDPVLGEKECSVKRSVQSCACDGCETPIKGHALRGIQVVPSLSSSDDYCCFDIEYYNNSDCEVYFAKEDNNDPVPSIIVDAEGASTIPALGWNAEPYISPLAGTTLLKQNGNKLVFHKNQATKIGTVCYPKSFLGPIIKTINVTANPCSSSANYIAICDKRPGSCCDYYTVYTHACNNTVDLQYHTDLPEECKIYGYRIRMQCGNEVYYVTRLSNGIALPIPKLPSLSRYYIELPNWRPCCVWSLDMDFYGINNEVLCHKVGSTGSEECEGCGIQSGSGIPKGCSSGTEEKILPCDGGIMIYPTPAKENSSLRILTDNAGSCMVRITDLQGREVYNFRVEKLVQGANDISLDKMTLENGTYFIKVEAGECVYTTKFIMLR